MARMNDWGVMTKAQTINGKFVAVSANLFYATKREAVEAARRMGFENYPGSAHKLPGALLNATGMQAYILKRNTIEDEFNKLVHDAKTGNYSLIGCYDFDSFEVNNA